MGSITIHCWKNCNGVSSFSCILLRHSIFYSTSAAAATTTGSSISTSEEPNSLSFFTNWLMNSLDFSEKEAISTTSKLTKRRIFNGAKRLSDPNILIKADSVIDFLQQKGLQKPEIKNVVYHAPHILISRFEQTLEPKMKFFQDLGLSVSDFARVIPAQPRLLYDGLNSTIRPVIEHLREIMGNDEDVVRVIKGVRFNMLRSVPKYLVRNVSTLRALGIPIESIQKRILQFPSSFMPKPEAFEEILAQAETKWGIPTHSPMFLDAIHVLNGLSEETMESKCRVFEGFGWDRSDLEGLFRRRPFVFALSEGYLKEKLSFLMDKLGYEPGYLVTNSTMLTYSLGKRLVPRYLVFQVLKEKGLIREDLALSRVMKNTESLFLERFVRPFEGEIPDLLQMYTANVSPSSPQQYKRRGYFPWGQRFRVKKQV